MASFDVWLELLSYTKALFEAATLGVDIAEAWRRHRQERDTIAEAQRVSALFSTYSEKEVQAILDRLKAVNNGLSRKEAAKRGGDACVTYSGT